MNQNINRRDFVRYSVLTALGLQFLPFQGLKAAASDKIRIAHIGLGGIGLAHMN